MKTVNLPALSGDSGLRRYYEEIRNFPVLSQEEEYELSRKLHDEGDLSAAHKLVTSHLRLVYKMAMGFRGYGLPLSDLIAEGNIGLMQAVKKFKREKGFRLATYAMWWIKAAMQEFILKSWSLVRFGSSATQKRLFFNLRKIKSRITAVDDGEMRPEHIKQIATTLNVSEEDVIDMDRRISYGGDQYLNQYIGNDTENEFIDSLPDTRLSQEQAMEEKQESSIRHRLFASAMKTLNERERDILVQRRLIEPPLTLDELSQKYSISKERVRQIENKAFEKLQKIALSNAA